MRPERPYCLTRGLRKSYDLSSSTISTTTNIPRVLRVLCVWPTPRYCTRQVKRPLYTAPFELLDLAALLLLGFDPQTEHAGGMEGARALTI